MKKGEICTGVIEKVDFPNKGIMHIEDEKVVVKHALPGQTVEVMITKRRKDKCEGRLLNVVKRADWEYDAPRCPHADECGGCSYQTLPYEEQLKLKEAQVKALLAPVLPEGFHFEGIKGSPLEEGTAIRWNSLLVMDIRMARWNLVCISAAVFMIL